MPPCHPDGYPDRCPARAPRTPVPGALPADWREVCCLPLSDGRADSDRETAYRYSGHPPENIFETHSAERGHRGQPARHKSGVCRNSPGSWPIRPRCKFLCSMQDSSLCGLEDCSSAPSYAVGRAAAPAGHRRPRACPRRIALFFSRSFLDRAWKGQEFLDSQIAFCLESRYNENPRNPLGGT